MEKNSIERPVGDAYTFIKNDYLNLYGGPIAVLFGHERMIDSLREKGIWPPKVLTFAERYKHKFNFTESDNEKIKRLDELSAEANRILSEPSIDKGAFLEVAMAAAEVCDRPDMAETFKNRSME